MAGERRKGKKINRVAPSPLRNVPRTEEVKKKISFTKLGMLLSDAEKAERSRAIDRKWKRENREKINVARRRYNENNREKIRARKKKKWAENVNHKLSECIRHRIRKAIRGISATKHTISLLGCTVAELRAHLESQFSFGMSWDNYGYRGWHVDHIRPCCTFDLTDENQRLSCFHYSNLQPLWRIDNQSKKRKAPE